MDTEKIRGLIRDAELRFHGKMSVYTTNDEGNLVPVTGVKVQVMRDEIEVPIFVIER